MQKFKKDPIITKTKIKDDDKVNLNISITDTTTLLSNIYDSSVFIDTNLLVDTLNVLDSLIMKYPSLISLRLAVSENIKNNAIQKTENQLVVEILKEKMQDYYKMKYPTPVHKFGENGRGVGISIPIDDIIELFK